jgi:hypothetical protein
LGGIASLLSPSDGSASFIIAARTVEPGSPGEDGRVFASVAVPSWRVDNLVTVAAPAWAWAASQHARLDQGWREGGEVGTLERLRGDGPDGSAVAGQACPNVFHVPAFTVRWPVAVSEMALAPEGVLAATAHSFHRAVCLAGNAVAPLLVR